VSVHARGVPGAAALVDGEAGRASREYLELARRLAGRDDGEQAMASKALGIGSPAARMATSE